MLTFEQYLEETYTKTELQDIARHGCEGGVSGMIYYEETTELYKAFTEDLHSIVDLYSSEQGYIPEYIIKHIGSPELFYNAMVWFCTELIASNLTHEMEV